MHDICKHESHMPLGNFWYVSCMRGHLNWGLEGKTVFLQNKVKGRDLPKRKDGSSKAIKVRGENRSNLGKVKWFSFI